MVIKLSREKPIVMGIGILLIAECLSKYIRVLKYADEFISVIFFLYLLFALLKRKHFTGVTKSSFLILLVILTIGISSNVISRVQTSKVAVVLDVISNFKLLVCFFGVYEYMREEDAAKCLNAFLWMARLFLICGTVLAVANLFADFGMRDAARFGIPSFRFIYSAPHIYSMAILTALLIVIQSDKKWEGCYLAMTMIQMVLTTKGTSLVWVAAVLLIVYYMKFHKRIHITMIIGLVLVGLALGQYQISNYLVREIAPRYILIKNGIANALNYFPIGSGFATYGSNMSYVYYSPLYYKYGMSVIFSFVKENITGAATDCYWPMVMGQGGFVSAVLMLYVYWKVFLLIQMGTFGKFEKSILISVFVYFITHTIGAVTPAMSSAVTMFMVIALVLKKNDASGEARISVGKRTE